MHKVLITELCFRELIRELMDSNTPIVPNPIVDPQAAETDPSNQNFIPSDKSELMSALRALINPIDNERAPQIYIAIKDVIEKEETKMNDAKIEESLKRIIRKILQETLSNVKLPKRTLSEYFVKDPKTGEMIWQGSGPAPKLSSSAAMQNLDPSARGIPQGPNTPAGRAQQRVFKKMNPDEFDEPLDSDKPEAGRTRRNKMGDSDGLKKIAEELGFKNPNGALQFMNRVLEKFKSRFINYNEVFIASLEIMKEYVDELASPYKQNSKTTTGPVISTEDAELLKQHPEMIKDLETFKTYLNKKLKDRGL